MYLFFDTETTGLPADYKAPDTAVDNWPRLVQLSFILQEHEAAPPQEFDFIVKPDGFIIPEDVAKIHGITTERAIKEGFLAKFVLDTFVAAMDRSDSIVAHNISFDRSIVGCEFYRLGEFHPMARKKNYCTKMSGTEFCKLPGKFGKYKWPRLCELYRALFGEDFDGAHNSLNDIRATARCFWEMKRRGIIA